MSTFTSIFKYGVTDSSRRAHNAIVQRKIDEQPITGLERQIRHLYFRELIHRWGAVYPREGRPDQQTPADSLIPWWSLRLAWFQATRVAKGLR
jgi:hypothetical protein